MRTCLDVLPDTKVLKVQTFPTFTGRGLTVCTGHSCLVSFQYIGIERAANTNFPKPECLIREMLRY